MFPLYSTSMLCQRHLPHNVPYIGLPEIDLVVFPRQGSPQVGSTNVNVALCCCGLLAGRYGHGIVVVVSIFGKVHPNRTFLQCGYCCWFICIAVYIEMRSKNLNCLGCSFYPEGLVPILGDLKIGLAGNAHLTAVAVKDGWECNGRCCI